LFTSNKPQEKIDLVHELVFENKYTTAIFKNEFFSGQKFNEESFKSLLFYLGLLTIKERELGWLRLKIPNYAMTELYFPYCLKSMTGYSHFF